MIVNKRYSPIVHGKASALALYLAEQATRFVLQEEMVRFLHFTMDEMAWSKADPCYGYSHYFKSEVTASVKCRSGKLVEVEIKIVLKQSNGEWEIDGLYDVYRIRFPGCKILKETCIDFTTRHYIDDQIYGFVIWRSGEQKERCASLSDEPISPNNPVTLKIKEELITT